VVDHANLVKLIGFCAEDDERGMQLLLVYEFMPNGSLADHLSSRSPRPASWAMRLRVALDTARGLKYLHEESEFKVRFFIYLQSLTFLGLQLLDFLCSAPC
jgi:serine/threonine protein kinase